MFKLSVCSYFAFNYLFILINSLAVNDKNRRMDQEKLIIKTQENSPKKIILNSRNLRFDKNSEKISVRNQRRILSEIFDILLATVIYTKNSNEILYDGNFDFDFEQVNISDNNGINKKKKNSLFSPNTLNDNNDNSNNDIDNYNNDNNINNNNNNNGNNNKNNNNNYNNNNINNNKNDNNNNVS